MKKNIALSASLALLTAACAFGQGATDAFTLSQTQLRGTARYMSMAGAFGALGGDLSTLNQNPAGIGVYRSSEIGATLDIDMQRSTLNTGFDPYTHKQTRAACNNFGYVGSVRTGSEVMPYFSWGATYNRINSFERRFRGYFPTINTSWTNYAASVSGGYPDQDLLGTDSYDPFFDSDDVPWISALAYNNFLISPVPSYNPANQNSWQYQGLYGAGSVADAEVEVHQKGYVDEYSINFGGNFANMVFWGLGFGITDLSFSQSTYYNEQIADAYVPNANQTAIVRGDAEWGIENYQTVGGTGFNVKFGLIFKPVNEFRIGLAVHTPTWYSLNFTQNAWVDYGLGSIQSDGYYTFDSQVDNNSYTTTQTGYFSRKLKTPWRFMASAAGVFAGRFILSADYVYEAYPAMRFSDDWGELTEVAGDVKEYYEPSSELRIGAEFRVTPKFSIRAGYGLKTTGAKADVRDGSKYIYTTGTQTIYQFDGDRHNVTFGLGYRFGGFYVDAAFVHTTQKSDWSAFTNFPRSQDSAYQLASGATTSPRAKITDTRNQLVLSVGFKF